MILELLHEERCRQTHRDKEKLIFITTLKVSAKNDVKITEAGTHTFENKTCNVSIT
jgi:hypothetical protein